jgi:SAM-dependent methyltransferase
MTRVSWYVIPKRFLKRFLRALGLGQASFRLMAAWREHRLGTSWVQSAGLQQRRYASEAQYVAHQKTKLRVMDPEWVKGQDERLRSALRARVEVAPGSRVLCLGARSGAEVRAFLDRGCFAVGVDLNPGVENPYVVVGDFHHLEFPDTSVDVVYTNCLDHVRDLSEVVSEVRRVLAPGGRMLVDAARGTEPGWVAGYWESFAWPTVAGLVDALEAAGLKAVKREPITEPWPGEHITLRALPAPG